MKLTYSLFLIGLGGSLGAMSRYLVTLLCQPLSLMPLGTLLVNLLGCLLIGFIVGLVDASVAIPSTARLFIVTGFCGAFTTMSSFVYETDRLLRTGETVNAALYFGATIIGSFALFFLGFFLIRFFTR